MNSSALKSNRKELVDTLFLMALQGANLLVPVIIIPYLMMTLGAAGYGRVGFALSAAQYLIIIVDFGFNLSATKSAALAKGDRRRLTELFWSVVWVKSLLLVASLAVLVAVMMLVPQFATYRLAVWMTVPQIVGHTFTFTWLFQGIGKVRTMSVINILCKVAMLPLVLWLVRGPEDYALAAFLQASVFLLAAVLTGVWLYRLHVVGRPVVSRATMRREAADSFPLFLSQTSTSVYTQLFAVILGLFCTEAEVGSYTAAERIMRALCFLVYQPLSQAFFPQISALSERMRGEALKKFALVKRIVLLSMAGIGLVLFVGAPYAEAWLGGGYEGLATLLRIFAFTPVFISLGGVYGQFGLVALGDSASRLRFRNVYFFVAAFAITGVLFAAPLFHTVGAATVLLLSEAFVCGMMAYYNKR
ncbi:MAG: oligosaccharide flippase family protein [Bacteroidaceae bacterium]|nr:oligosaccharide flippase family protein [Bacteroidaceae bacterium]